MSFLTDDSADTAKAAVVPGSKDVGNEHPTAGIGRMHHFAVPDVQTHMPSTATEVEDQVPRLRLA